MLQAEQKFFLVPAHRVADVCGKPYDADLNVQATVNMAAVSSGTWDLNAAAAAAKARDWTKLLRSSITTLAEAYSNALKLVAERNIISPWRDAVRPTCAHCSIACLPCAVYASSIGIYRSPPCCIASDVGCWTSCCQ